MARTRISRGVYRDRYGHEVRWREHGRTRAKRFPADAPLSALTDYRDTKERLSSQQKQRDAGGSFPRDAVRWLKSRRGPPGFKSDRSHLRPWIHRFKALSRYAITRDQIQAAIDHWKRAGYSAEEIRKRWKILRQCLGSLNGPDVPNPCAEVALPKKTKARQRRVSDDTIREVALQLYRHECLHRLHSAATRARFLVLATTGVRPVQLQRATPDELRRALETRIWNVEPAKGDDGTSIYLNDEMYAAIMLLLAANAIGKYDSRSFSKTLQRNGWPKGIRPYNARHAVGQALRRGGAELGDVQDHLGHSSPVTTRQFYLDPDIARLKATSTRLEGRLRTDPFMPPLPHATTTRARERKAKTLQKVPQNSGDPRGHDHASMRSKSSK